MDKGGVLQVVERQLSAAVMMSLTSCSSAADMHDTGTDSGFLTPHFCSENLDDIHV